MADHTALPWQVTCNPTAIIATGGSVVADCWLAFTAQSECEANAALIVQAVNAHPALVAALLLVSEYLDEYHDDCDEADCPVDGVLGEARAALALARGEVPS